MPNSGHGGPPGTRVVTIFVFYVNPQTPNIEKKIVDVICFKIFNIRNLSVDIKYKNGHKWRPWGSPWSEFGMYLTNIPPKVFSCPKDPNLN